MTSKKLPVVLSISRLSDTNEYKVVYKESLPDGRLRLDEAKAYYTNDPEDAVLTLRDEIAQLLVSGRAFKLGSKYTLRLVNRFSGSRGPVRS